ncbi:rhodanese-like domain-containing protein [Geoalkalibacter halelectricus]|uniref:ArsR family transcriptional regulator n=1 Tax=Geoalkalibacter halelectricus TaxID=2847045 RepID=A0ABY5ZK68_9BACT|nr:ArsR family transcriptional regulator [Geoalkalibacter halelectricus]MDO3379457.1 ArsR family transcriptional regulator [Geoalkalibacter halelectricus]UWZ79516.1 ArsR family transcriptional regulator [Geoalkalibacter halelectricus]
MPVPRIGPEEARAKVKAGSALLVCAYGEAEKFAQNHLEDALSRQDFEARLPQIAKDTEIIFYCA